MTIESAPSTAQQPAEQIFSLEQSYVRVPWEQARRSFRGQIKIVDKDIPQLFNAISGKNLDLDPELRSRLGSRLKMMVERLLECRREVKAFKEKLLYRCGQMGKACSDLSHELRLEPQNSDKDSRWLHHRLNRLVAEYLLRLGFFQTADVLVNQFGLKRETDEELFKEAQSIATSLLRGDAAACLAWCSENRSQLKKNKCPIEFLLRRQEFIEKCRRRELKEAISYAKKHFNQFIELHNTEIEQALALLAVGPETTVVPYRWLYESKRWNDIAGLFLQANLDLYGLPPISQLESLIYGGLSILKTPHCTASKSASADCPVCSAPFSQLSHILPSARHETSILICPITGRSMDADNSPMALPSGLVYSQKALEALAASKGGSIQCPRTKVIYNIAEARKCFIL